MYVGIYRRLQPNLVNKKKTTKNKKRQTVLYPNIFIDYHKKKQSFCVLYRTTILGC